VIKELPYEVVKEKYQEFVHSFLSGEPCTQKTELLPNLWAVVNKKHDFHVSIEWEFRVKDLRTMEKEWFAVVTQFNPRGDVLGKDNFLLEF
jgi:hypothetical protein